MGVLVSTDTGTKLYVTCVDRDTHLPMDLSGCQVNLRWKDANGILVSNPMVVVSATNGTAEYLFQANELYAPKMIFEIEVVDSLGHTLTSTELLSVQVREKLA